MSNTRIIKYINSGYDMTFMYCSVTVRPQLILCPVLFITRYYMDHVYRIQKKDLATNKFDKHDLWKKIF